MDEPLNQTVFVSFRIGFLGLGLMGSGIVSNLLKMGHTVTVWNRTAEKVSIKGEVCHFESGVTGGSYSVFPFSSVLYTGK